MNNIISQNIQLINALCKSHHVNELYAFGSVCTNSFNENSDIDFLVSFDSLEDYGDYADNYFDLAEQFEKIFNRPVDLVTNNSLSNPYFIASINETKTLLYGQ